MGNPAIRPFRFFYGWWVLVSSSAAVAIGFSIAAYVLPVFYPELVQGLSWPRTSVVFGGSIQLLLVGLIAPVNGWLIDRHGARRMLVMGTLTLALAFTLLANVRSLWEYYLVCFAIGLGGSWVHHLPNQLLVSNWFVRRRGLAIGIMTTAAGLGASVVSSVAATLIARFGWRRAAFMLPLLLIVPFVLAVFVTRNQPGELGLHPDGAAAAASPGAAAGGMHRAADRADGAPRLWTRPAFWVLGASLLLGAAACFAVWPHLVSFLRARTFSPGTAAFVYSVFLACSAIGRFACGPLSDRISPSYLLATSFVMVAIGMAVLVVAQSLTIFYVFAVVFGIGYGGTITLRPLFFFEHFGSIGVGKYYGVAQALFSTGSFVGPLAVAHIVDRGGSYERGFELALAAVMMAAVAVLGLKYSQVRVARDLSRVGA